MGLPLLQPESLKDSSFRESLTSLKPELFVVVAFRILPSVLLGIPRRGAINLHASLLPAYRGAAPIQWALINGETVTGLTTFLIEPKVDRGAILLQKKIPIDPEDNYGSLADRMSELGADLVLRSIDGWEAGQIIPQHQDHSQATAAPKIKPEHRQINWSLPALQIHNLIRGLAPQPGAFTTWKKRTLKVFSSRVVELEGTAQPPGTITTATGNQFIVQTGDHGLALLEAQLEGKKRLSIEEFLRGCHFSVGERLGS
jgi:methionyl-tRNA formyltransferase